jgi:hypothetical protein
MHVAVDVFLVLVAKPEESDTAFRYPFDERYLTLSQGLLPGSPLTVEVLVFRTRRDELTTNRVDDVTAHEAMVIFTFSPWNDTCCAVCSGDIVDDTTCTDRLSPQQ